MYPKQPTHCRAWQRSQIPWPGRRPQVHLHIPGAVILLPAFHRARAATRHQIRNKGETGTYIFCLQGKRKDILLLKPQNSSVYKEFLVCPLTLLVLFSSYPTLGSSHAAPCPADLPSSCPGEEKQEQNISLPKPQHPAGKPDVSVGILGTCMEKSPDGQRLYIIQSRQLVPWVQNYQW